LVDRQRPFAHHGFCLCARIACGIGNAVKRFFGINGAADQGVHVEADTRQRALAGNEQHKSLTAAIATNARAIAEREAEVAALIDERRALEWIVREGMVRALLGKRNDNSPVDIYGFDDAMLNSMDESAEMSAEALAAFDAEAAPAEPEQATFELVTSDEEPGDIPF
jgi:hypothetical protein